MNTKTLEYKGFQGSIDCDTEAGVLHGKLLHINDLITYESDTINGLKEEFQLAVDDYLETCEEMGVEPNKPMSGSFNVRIGPALHRDLAKFSTRNGKTINECVKDAIDCHINGRHNEIHHHHHHQRDSEYQATEILATARRPKLRVVR